jgi:hypothetical protein
MAKLSNIRIGGTSISIEMDCEVKDCGIEPSYLPFAGSGKTDITLRLHQGNPHSELGEMVFDCPPIWTLYRQNGNTAIKIFDSQLFPGFERTLVFPRPFEKADLYFTGHFPADANPFHGPTVELLMVNYLAQGRGIILHACGIAREGEGTLFVGESGTGKSTLARMWAGERGIEVLSDDRIIVRKQGDQFWMYGTPWHGDAKFASPKAVRVERILFLKHGYRNSIERVKGFSLMSRLVQCSFPTHWDSKGMAFTLETFADLASRVPCHVLSFRPDRSAVEFVRQIAA